MPDPYITKAEKLCPKKKGCPAHKGDNSPMMSVCETCEINWWQNEIIDLCLPIVAELLKEQDELTNKIAEIFHEQLKGVYAADPVSALEAIADMISSRDAQIADLLKRVDEISNSAQFRRVGEQQKRITELEEEVKRLTGGQK